MKVYKKYKTLQKNNNWYNKQFNKYLLRKKFIVWHTRNHRIYSMYVFSESLCKVPLESIDHCRGEIEHPKECVRS